MVSSTITSPDHAWPTTDIETRTVVANLPSVAQSLARPPAYVIKYFGFELGAQTNIDPKDDRWIVNGAHEASKLQDYLDGFIKKYVLCKDCQNPETVVSVKDGNILLDCKACGQRTQADMRHKLASSSTEWLSAASGWCASTACIPKAN